MRGERREGDKEMGRATGFSDASTLFIPTFFSQSIKELEASCDVEFLSTHQDTDQAFSAPPQR
jgi:hypothetical protein